ncbi:related to Ferric reductase transmembrane component 1 precursor [Melanopsichium pennsylvanicum]|uniref:ferric-chelate reductase (NADPH) n=2 Tax=Melanopsichium pennsylvanicum TaxID=63383 RepID=A0AAJ4XGN1_9BASI|nr:related to Ferric reductase transmembrane component 1 precursor [Melanopsichium pennsylvanicum 4]SNX81700.1 related to Ferric reductase transmembrane component 1 precursor [Melanopsichium pennsylvanicum]
MATTMEHTILRRHKEAPGCVWQPGMVGPTCRPSSALKKAAMKGKDSYYEMEKYSRITTWVLLSLLGIVILRGLVAKLRHSRKSRFSSTILAMPGYKQLAAVCRGIGYYRPKKLFARKTVLDDLVSADRFPSMGNILFLGIPAIGFVAWCFAVKPYYRPTVVWGSTPLGVRAGMIANAFFPWLFACGLKFNPLTFLTGVSHEKLQFYHQWIARIILFFAVVHTVPFLWQPIHDGGLSNLKAWYYYDKVWWTGTVALAMLAWLVASSFGYFRRMSYEFFVLQHVLTIIIFLVFYFMHTRDLINSWAWLWPSIGVWGFHVLFKFANSLRISRFTGVPATITLVDENEKLIKLEVVAPVSWLPGQHFFLRFSGINKAAPYQTHPFTVANLPSPDNNLDSHLIFYFKAREGLTAKIWELLMRQPAVKGKVSTMLKVALDGPYGSPSHPTAYHSDLIIAGGVGITSVLPALMSLCLASRSSQEAVTTRIAVHWSVQTMRIFDAFEPSLRPMLEHLRALGVDTTLDVYCREASSMAEDVEKVAIDSAPAKLFSSMMRLHAERANLPRLITDFVNESKSSRSVGVSVCGPASMLNETANTVARLQWSHVLSSSSSLEELYLHTEAFDW